MFCKRVLRPSKQLFVATVRPLEGKTRTFHLRTRVQGLGGWGGVGGEGPGEKQGSVGNS